nr:hypothetical protein [Angustibacter aerolatus]
MLDARIERRVVGMWAGGLLDEVRRLDRLGLRTGLTASRAVGYAQALAEARRHLDHHRGAGRHRPRHSPAGAAPAVVVRPRPAHHLAGRRRRRARRAARRRARRRADGGRRCAMMGA